MSRVTSLWRSGTTLPPTAMCVIRHCPGPLTSLGRESAPMSANVSCVCCVQRTCTDSDVLSAHRLPPQVPQGTRGSRRVGHAALRGRYRLALVLEFDTSFTLSPAFLSICSLYVPHRLCSFNITLLCHSNYLSISSPPSLSLLFSSLPSFPPPLSPPLPQVSVM